MEIPLLHKLHIWAKKLKQKYYNKSDKFELRLLFRGYKWNDLTLKYLAITLKQTLHISLSYLSSFFLFWFLFCFSLKPSNVRLFRLSLPSKRKSRLFELLAGCNARAYWAVAGLQYEVKQHVPSFKILFAIIFRLQIRI